MLLPPAAMEVQRNTQFVAGETYCAALVTQVCKYATPA